MLTTAKDLHGLNEDYNFMRVIFGGVQPEPSQLTYAVKVKRIVSPVDMAEKRITNEMGAVCVGTTHSTVGGARMNSVTSDKGHTINPAIPGFSGTRQMRTSVTIAVSILTFVRV